MNKLQILAIDRVQKLSQEIWEYHEKQRTQFPVPPLGKMAAALEDGVVSLKIRDLIEEQKKWTQALREK